jgi:hypothetical protein
MAGTNRPRQHAAGISNRETPEQEADERNAFPPINGGPPEAEDAGGSRGDADVPSDGSQTSHKAGSRSVAQKEAGSRYPDRSMPATRKVEGAFGRESDEPGARDVEGTSHPGRAKRTTRRRSS